MQDYNEEPLAAEQLVQEQYEVWVAAVEELKERHEEERQALNEKHEQLIDLLVDCLILHYTEENPDLIDEVEFVFLDTADEESILVLGMSSEGDEVLRATHSVVELISGRLRAKLSPDGETYTIDLLVDLEDEIGESEISEQENQEALLESFEDVFESIDNALQEEHRKLGE